jgi:Neutral/alkaline non-lysosomal ceramidase, N-terminal
MSRSSVVCTAGLWLLFSASASTRADGLCVGFGEVDITPVISNSKPVYMAGFGQNRVATGVLDPLKVRAIVFADDKSTIAMVSLDLVGLSYGNTLAVRKRLPDFTYVLVSCTHSHEGPDTIGLWGPSPFKSGVDREYVRDVEDKIVQAVLQAKKQLKPAIAAIGMARDADLLHDSREPYVKHDELVAMRFEEPGKQPPMGILVQWNCHPETLADKNTKLSADYVATTVRTLQEKHHCPVIYFTGTVGGLMTSLNLSLKDDNGKELPGGSVAKTEKYGREIAKLADTALANSKPVTLVPLEARSKSVYLPLDNPQFLIARQVGLLVRDSFVWNGDWRSADPVKKGLEPKRLALRTEVAYLQLGQLDVALIPGEIYPELVLDKVQDPVDPGADFPDAPIEPGIYKQFTSPYHMMIGLANDEVGYIIPKRQWDEKPPFCYQRKKAQYGEGNSLGPDTAPVLCNAFKKLVNRK